MNKKQAIEELHTIKDFIRWGFSQLKQSDAYYGHGTDNAMDEIFVLILHALQLPHDFPESYFYSRLTTDERSKIVAWLERRIKERVNLRWNEPMFTFLWQFLRACSYTAP